MANLAGNIASKICFTLQFRASSFPWFRGNTAVLGLKGRDYNSSSVPVRYIPKRSSKSNEMENSLPKKSFEKRSFDKSLGLDKPQNQNRKRPSKESMLFDDTEQALQNTQNNAAVPKLAKEINCNLGFKNHELMEEPGQVIEEIRIQEEKDSLKHNMQVGAMLDVEKSAVEFLSTRAFTAVELRKKLLGKRFPSDIVDAVITNFQSRGLINDSLYAETFSRSRWSSSSWGPRRIKQALIKKGVSEADVEKALKLVFEDDESTYQESKVGLSKISMDHLLVQASKQWLRGQGAPKETRKSRIVRWLQYRGFNWDIISFVLKKLESQYPP